MLITQVSNGCYNCNRAKWGGIFRRQLYCMLTNVTMPPYTKCEYHIVNDSWQKIIKDRIFAWQIAINEELRKK